MGYNFLGILRRVAQGSIRSLRILGEEIMLRLADHGTAHTCDGVSRRDFLQVGALGAIGLTLPQALAAEAAGA